MWAFIQRTGDLLENELPYAQGYAGHGEGKNNPDLQSVHNVGPIPVGRYKIIGPPFTHPTAGLHTLRLEPCPGTNTFDRGGFLCHGDATPPGEASEGCIVIPDPVKRIAIWTSGDHDLEVRAEPVCSNP